MASSQPRQYPRYRKSGPPSRRDQQSSQKRRHYAGHHRKRGRPPLPVLVLPHAEEERDLEAHPEPQTSQQEVHPTGEVQDGDSHINPPPTAPRDVGILRRSKGCLPTYPHPTRGPAVPRVQVQGHRLPLHSATIWPLHGTQGFHQGNKGGPGSPPPKRGNGVRLPRRLVSTRQLPTRGSRQYKRHRLPPDETGVVNQCREIQPRAHSIDHILRGPSRPRQRHGLPDGRKNGKPSGHGQKNTRQSEYPSAHVAAPIGEDGELHRPSRPVQTQNEAAPAAPPQTLCPGSVVGGNANPTSNGASPVSHVVGRVGQDRGRATFPEPSPYNVDHDGCLPQRLGSGMGHTHSCRRMGGAREGSPYQYFRDGSGPEGRTSLGNPPNGPHCHGPVRQHHDRGVYQPSRGHSIPGPPTQDMGPARPLRLPSDRPTGVPPSRERQYTGRRTVQGVSRQWGMGALPNVVRPHIPPVRQAVRRHVRDGQERQTPDVLLQIPRPAGLEDRRPSRLMGGPLHVRLSPTGITPQNSHDASGRGSGHAFDRTLLAQSSMVPTHHRNAGGPTIQIPTAAKLLSQRSGHITHPDITSLHLAAWKLSGSRSRQRGFHRRLRTLQWMPAGSPRLKHTILDCTDTMFGPGTTLLIPWRPQ
ncbi:hypothetical protein BSL78_12634 [Apostichopus japonicus]|uniref:Uncharacterized protein n=1 Tax=Stichopus japonicus TaxID=307972 RepID=A0A2G8KR69_STIJA|nr:hypothetical protein BSL78_12634 [Apostichopus japonicus]